MDIEVPMISGTAVIKPKSLIKTFTDIERQKHKPKRQREKTMDLKIQVVIKHWTLEINACVPYATPY